MEKRTFTNILVTLAVLALIPIGFGVYTYLTNQYIDWNETYQVDSKEPYNNYMVFNLLKSYKADKEFVFVDNLLTERLAEEEIKNAKEPISYIFVGSTPFLLSDEIDSLMSFVAKGKTAFFAANTIPDTVYTILGLNLELSSRDYNYYNKSNGMYDSLVSTNFFNSSIKNDPIFKFNYRRKNESVGTYWHYFSDYDIQNSEKKKAGIQYNTLGYLNKLTELEDNTITYNNYQDNQEYSQDNYSEDESYQNNEDYSQENYAEDESSYTNEITENKENDNIASKNELLNFIRIKHGKGYFYFHRNPVLFTNYYLIQEDGKKYVERALSYLPEGDILWDERSHFYKRSNNPDIGGGGKRNISPSPLSYILSQESLAWAYYTLLVSALLFIIFRGKRMQRIIPILRKEENTSLEFTKTVGQLYYLQKDHKRLSQLKIRLFFDYIRTHYYMNTQHIDEDFRKKLSERSGINRELIDLLLSDIQKVNGQHEVSEWLLRKIHTQIQEFYTNCK